MNSCCYPVAAGLWTSIDSSSEKEVSEACTRHIKFMLATKTMCRITCRWSARIHPSQLFLCESERTPHILSREREARERDCVYRGHYWIHVSTIAQHQHIIHAVARLLAFDRCVRKMRGKGSKQQNIKYKKYVSVEQHKHIGSSRNPKPLMFVSSSQARYSNISNIFNVSVRRRHDSL